MGRIGRLSVTGLMAVVAVAVTRSSAQGLPDRPMGSSGSSAISAGISTGISGSSGTSAIPIEEVRETFDHFYRQANESVEWLTEFRRELHQYPEIGLETYETSERVLRELKKLGIDTQSGWAKDLENGIGGAGIVVDLVSGSDSQDGPTVLLRADMDALPINELTDVPFKSKTENKMHACGHDVHTTMLLGAVKLLTANRDKWSGTIRIVFQPAEEIALGSPIMIKEGMLKWNGKNVDSAFALHIWPISTTGNIVAAPGVALAGGSMFNITLTGTGGHVGRPAAATDAIVAAGALIQNAQILASRETFGIAKDRYGLISFGQIHSSPGPANVLPRQVKLSGYVRSASGEILKVLERRLTEMVASLKASHQIDGEIEFGFRVVPTLNNGELVEAHEGLMGHASRSRGMIEFNRQRRGEYSFGMEDFGYVSQEVPSVFYILTTGTGSEIPNHPPTNLTLHSEYFAADERIIPRGAAFLASLAVDELKRLTHKHTNTHKTNTQEL